MSVLISTTIFWAIKVLLFGYAALFVEGHPFMERALFICAALFFIRCVIFKETKDEEFNFFHHGDFISEIISLAIFYFFTPHFKMALYFHLSFGFLHYFQYIFGFIIPEGFGLIWQGIRGIFSAPKRTYPRVVQATPRAQPSPPPGPPLEPQIERKITPEEKPKPIKEAPKGRPSIYDI